MKLRVVLTDDHPFVLPGLRSVRIVVPPLLEQADVMRLREWHHRLAGAVGVLQYPALLAELETFRRHMNSHTAGQLREEGYALIRTCQEMLGGIEQQAALLT